MSSWRTKYTTVLLKKQKKSNLFEVRGMLAGKNILLGVCGSIAAYKSAFLVRLMVKAGAAVKVVMTQPSTDFIAPLTLATLSKNPVSIDFSDDKGNWNNHVELGLWADMMVIAPATADTLAKMANGICDNLLLATYLSARCPVVVSPAMDLDMWKHPATQNNINTLKQYGVGVIPVNSGELASGLVGEGRMAEPEEIATYLAQALSTDSNILAGKKVLITAGPTREAIDPVRYITNHSTGKMGFALARKFAGLGAEVTLIKGPTSYNTGITGVNIVEVTTAEEMFKATTQAFESASIAVMAAAVSDYAPAEKHKEKLKKQDDTLVLRLQKTKDILAHLGKHKKTGQLLVGFALETEHELEHAQNKLMHKNADMMVLNSLKDSGAGFGFDTNKVSILFKDGTVKAFELKSKDEVATDIVHEILQLNEV